jgi:tRNA(fMet)-specific endonuclease VapC
MLPALLDTNILSEVLKSHDVAVVKKGLAYLQEHGPLVYSAISRYEVIRGYLNVNAVSQLSRFATFCSQSLVLPVTDSVLDRAAELWTIARRHGYPRDDADLIIASTALEHERVLVTGNTAHFAWIQGLQLDDWRVP